MDIESGKKRVWFSESSNIIHPLQYDQDKDDLLRWYSHQDLMRFSFEMRRSALTLSSKQQRLEDHDREKVALNNVLSRIFSACREEKLPTESDFRRYMSWNKFSPDLRGIERYCAGDMADLLSEHNIKVIKELLLFQNELRKEGLAPDISCELIRSAYMKEVKAYRILARIQGIIDAALASICRKDIHSTQENTQH